MSAAVQAPAKVETLGMVATVKGSRGDVYIVRQEASGRWSCTCPDFAFRDRACKHMQAALAPVMALAQQVQAERR